MLKIDIISVQPKMFEGFLRESIVARAVKKGVCEIQVVDLREFGEGRWRKVDDKPYGGGPGMLMCCQPWFAAVESSKFKVQSSGDNVQTRVIMTSPTGKRFTQKDAEMFAHLATHCHLPTTNCHLIFLCGHYEGFDARIETLATDKYSLGDFVMTGGELAAGRWSIQSCGCCQGSSGAVRRRQRVRVSGARGYWRRRNTRIRQSSAG